MPDIGQTLLITDASMTELIRPALYEAVHDIVPIQATNSATSMVQIVGPVCESSDVLGRDRLLPEMQPRDLVAILTSMFFVVGDLDK